MRSKINAMRRMLATGLALLAVVPAVQAGPFFSAGGMRVTPTSYVVTIKTIEFKRSDGSYYTFFSGPATMDIASVAAGSVAGSIGVGQSLPAGTYNGIRVTFSRNFSITATSGASPMGPGTAAFCRTGGTGDFTWNGYTVQVVTRNGPPGSPVRRTLSLPPQANTAINAISGMAIVGTSSDIQITHSLAALTVLGTDTVMPAFTVQFDVTNAVEFLNDGTSCYALFLPPTVTYITPTGTSTFAAPSL